MADHVFRVEIEGNVFMTRTDVRGYAHNTNVLLRRLYRCAVGDYIPESVRVIPDCEGDGFCWSATTTFRYCRRVVAYDLTMLGMERYPAGRPFVLEKDQLTMDLPPG